MNVKNSINNAGENMANVVHDMLIKIYD